MPEYKLSRKSLAWELTFLVLYVRQASNSFAACVSCETFFSVVSRGLKLGTIYSFVLHIGWQSISRKQFIGMKGMLTNMKILRLQESCL